MENLSVYFRAASNLDIMGFRIVSFLDDGRFYDGKSVMLGSINSATCEGPGHGDNMTFDVLLTQKERKNTLKGSAL